MDQVLSNTPVWYTVLAESFSCVLYVLLLEQRAFTRGKAVAALFIFGGQCLYFKYLGGIVYDWIGPGAMIAPYLLMFSYFAFCCRCDWRKKIYYAIRAFVLAEFLASLEWSVYLRIGPWLPELWQEAACLLLVYGSICLLLYGMERNTIGESLEMRITPSNLFASALIGFGIYVSSGWGIVYAPQEVTGEYGIALFFTRTLINLAGVVMLYAHNTQICKLYINNELRSVESILRNQYKQYQLSQECIDLINFKYHDLKHQIHLWQGEAGSQRHRQYLQELQEKIDGYSLQQHTGNDVLDTILTEKELICKQKHIQITSVVNGALLAFLPLEDLCAMFGNALDNAIEAAEQITDVEKRLIRVVVHQAHNCVMIQIENYTEAHRSIDGGLPPTTKGDSTLHGYGLKSIQYIAAKHQGMMAVDCKNNWFILKIMLPIELRAKS